MRREVFYLDRGLDASRVEIDLICHDRDTTVDAAQRESTELKGDVIYPNLRLNALRDEVDAAKVEWANHVANAETEVAFLRECVELLEVDNAPSQITLEAIQEEMTRTRYLAQKLETNNIITKRKHAIELLTNIDLRSLVEELSNSITADEGTTG